MRARGLSSPRVIVPYRLGRMCPIRVCMLVLIISQVTPPKIFLCPWRVGFQGRLDPFCDVSTHLKSFHIVLCCFERIVLYRFVSFCDVSHRSNLGDEIHSRRSINQALGLRCVLSFGMTRPCVLSFVCRLCHIVVASLVPYSLFVAGGSALACVVFLLGSKSYTRVNLVKSW